MSRYLSESRICFLDSQPSAWGGSGYKVWGIPVRWCFDVGCMGLEDTHLGVWVNSLFRDLCLVVSGEVVYSFLNLHGTSRYLLSSCPGGIFWDSSIEAK